MQYDCNDVNTNEHQALFLQACAGIFNDDHTDGAEGEGRTCEKHKGTGGEGSCKTSPGNTPHSAPPQPLSTDFDPAAVSTWV